MPSHGMAHALYEGDFKLMLDVNNDAPAALYDLKNDLAEQKNLIAEPAHADRVKRMEATYRAIPPPNAAWRSLPRHHKDNME